MLEDLDRLRKELEEYSTGDDEIKQMRSKKEEADKLVDVLASNNSRG